MKKDDCMHNSQDGNILMQEPQSRESTWKIERENIKEIVDSTRSWFPRTPKRNNVYFQLQKKIVSCIEENSNGSNRSNSFIHIVSTIYLLFPVFASSASSVVLTSMKANTKYQLLATHEVAFSGHASKPPEVHRGVRMIREMHGVKSSNISQTTLRRARFSGIRREAKK